MSTLKNSGRVKRNGAAIFEKHGHTCKDKDTKTYVTWMSMRSRCKATKGHHARFYALAGISVCREWDSFEVFLFDMGSRPPNCTLDRIDTARGYSKENCRWATPKEQARNSKKNVRMTYIGVTKCLSEWAEIYSLSNQTVWKRLNLYGWSTADTLEIRPMLRKVYNGRKALFGPGF